jgi:HlyD family secretion protein
MSVKRSLLVLLLVMIIGPLVALNVDANRARAEVEARENALRSLQTYKVERGTIESVVSAIGTIDADRVVQASFLTAGKIRTLLVASGDYVFAGEPLAELENDTQRIVYEQALLALDAAQLELEELLKPVSEDDLALAQASVDSAWGAYMSAANAVTDEDIRAAELAYEQAYTTYESLKAARDQAPGGFGGSAYVQLDAQTGAASFNAEIARLRMESLKNASRPQANAAYARVVQAQKELERLQAGPQQVQLDSASLSIRRAESQLRRAETALNRTTLTAPIDGVISAVNAEVGAAAAPGVTLFEITDADPLRITVQVDEVDIRLIEAGMAAAVELDALDDVRIPAVIERIALIGTPVNGIVNYDVTLTIDSADARVRVGMTAEANIVTERRDDVLIVPNVYIRRDRERAFVNILRADDTLEEVEIRLGLQGRDSSEVVGGLLEGETIAVNTDSSNFALFGG